MYLIRRRFRSMSAFVMLIAFSAWSTALSGLSHAQLFHLPLGLGTGSGEAEISDDGKQWANLTPVSTPVFASTMIRTGKGLAWGSLQDGNQQVELHECGVIGIYGLKGSRAAKMVKIALGRILFRVPASSQTILATPTVQFQITGDSAAKPSAIQRVGAVAPPNSSDRVGWISVELQGISRIVLLQGRMLARPVNGGSTQIIEPGQTAEFPVKENGKEADPDFKTLRDNARSCPCLQCAAWIPEAAPFLVAAPLAGLTAAGVGAGVAGAAALGVGIGTTTGGPPPLPIASATTP
jgi:hypothetical protein